MELDTADGTARFAKASPFTIRRLGAAGKIKVYRLGRAVRYDPGEVIEFMRKEGEAMPSRPRPARKNRPDKGTRADKKEASPGQELERGQSWEV